MTVENNYPDGENNNDQKQQHLCPYCQKSFLKMEDLNLHVLTKHTGSYSLQKRVRPAQDDAPATATS